MIRIVVGKNSGEYVIHWHDGRVQLISSFWQVLCAAWRIAWSGQKVVVDNE